MLTSDVCGLDICYFLSAYCVHILMSIIIDVIVVGGRYVAELFLIIVRRLFALLLSSCSTSTKLTPASSEKYFKTDKVNEPQQDDGTKYL